MTAAAARRTAISAQGFGKRRPLRATRRTLASVVDTVNLLQIDSVSVAVRAHYAPVFSRIGPYDRGIVDAAAWTDTARSPRILVEYWAHEAALIPVQDWPLMRWRMRKYVHGRYGHAMRVTDRNPRLIDDVLAVVTEAGASTSTELETALAMERSRPKGPWWDPTDVKVVCEQLFASGVLSVDRREGFVRHYDLAERVLGPDIAHADVPEPDAIRALVAKSAAALGVATEPDLRDYYRLSRAQTTPAIEDLVEDGVLEPVSVRGWGAPAYLHRDAAVPRVSRATALLCPFDPLVFFRPRTERLFDFHYRIEIYTPAAKRRFGYYVFPYLQNGALTARVDLKVDRSADALVVPGAFTEPGQDPATVAESLIADLAEMAQWLGVSDVVVGERGDLAPALRRAAAAS